MCRPCSSSHQDTPPQTPAPLLTLRALCCVLRVACSGGTPKSRPRTGGIRTPAWGWLPFAPHRLFQCGLTEVSYAGSKLSCRCPALAGLLLHAYRISAGRGRQSMWCLDADGVPIESPNECCVLYGPRFALFNIAEVAARISDQMAQHAGLSMSACGAQSARSCSLSIPVRQSS